MVVVVSFVSKAKVTIIQFINTVSTVTDCDSVSVSVCWSVNYINNNTTTEKLL